jgi:hypothetical protein
MPSSNSIVGRDIILAGIPRGGTSLACVLLNQLSNTIALNEPLELSQLVSKNETDKIVWLKDQFAEARDNLSRNKTTLSKGKGGRLVSNLFSDIPAADGLRKNIATLQAISFPHFVDSRGFTLIIKHPNAFTVLLPLLRDHFECFAIVRNPLAVLLSWNSTRAKWQEGFVPMAEKLDELLHNQLMRAKSTFERQLFILARYFTIIREALPLSQVLRYEDIIETGGSVLSAICPEAERLACYLSNLNTNAAYDRAKVDLFTGELLHSSCNWAPFYGKKDIVSLSNNLI